MKVELMIHYVNHRKLLYFKPAEGLLILALTAGGCRWGFQLDPTPSPDDPGSPGGEGGIFGGTGGRTPTDTGGEGGVVGTGGVSSSECGDGTVNKTAGEECEPTFYEHCTNECVFSFEHFLVHRFSFGGTGTDAVDSVGDGDGLILSTTLDGSGQLVLTTGGHLGQGGQGGDVQFADLRNGLASEQRNATFEVWVTWDGGDPWQRVFDFGNSTNGETMRGLGNSYLFLTPLSLSGTLRASFSLEEVPQETFVERAEPMPVGVPTHVAVVMDDDGDEMRLYVNGALEGTAIWTESLSSIDDVNNWLGLSQYSWDPPFEGSIDEFRIYEAALSPEQVEDSFEAGTNL